MADIFIDPNLLNLTTTCTLCKQVEKKLGYDGMNLPLKMELIQTNQDVKEAMKRYFKNYLISDRVQKFLQMKTISSDFAFGTSLLKKQDEENISGNHPFYLNLIKKYIPPNPSDDIQLFGITREFVQKVLELKQRPQTEIDELNKFVGKEFEEFGFKITKYSHVDFRYPNNKRKAFKQAVDELNQMQNNLVLADIQMKNNEANINRLLSTYYMGLKKGISMLEKLVSLYETKLEFEFLLKDFYIQRCNGIESKVKRFELEILKATYFQKSILALKKISSDLDQKKKQLEEEKRQTSMKLQEFYVLGPDYDKIVKEYTELCKAIEEQQWALDSLIRVRRASLGSQSDVLQESHTENKSTEANTEECSKTENLISFSE